MEVYAMQGPYVFINDRAQPYPVLKQSLSLNPHTQTKFDTLNQHMRNTVVLPGQLVIIGIGAASSAWSKHLAQIEKTLKEIDDLHKQYLSKGTTAARNEFLAKRRALFATLDGQISGFARFGTGLKNEGSIKKMLGISSKSYWHHGQIRRYEDTVKRVAKASEMLKKGTYIGIALDSGATAMEIAEACSTGREQECTQAKYVEGGKLVFGVGSASLGGTIGASIGIGACMIVFGIPTAGAGALACAIVGGAAGGLALGKLGAEGGEIAGKFLYEAARD